MTNAELFADPEYERVTIAVADESGEWITADSSILAEVRQ